MTEKLQTPYVLDKADDIEKLGADSIVVVKESEFGDHVGWQLTIEEGEKVWVSIFYATKHDSVDLLNFSYDNKVEVVYVHPGK